MLLFFLYLIVYLQLLISVNFEIFTWNLHEILLCKNNYKI